MITKQACLLALNNYRGVKGGWGGVGNTNKGMLGVDRAE